MANEYLKRTPTSSGNRKVFTFSVWYKRLSDNGATDSRYFFLAGDTHVNLRGSGASNPDDIITNQRGASTNYFYHYAPARRDYSSWQHLLYAVDTTQTVEKHRGRVYINGVEQIESSSIGSSNAPLNDALSINNTVAHFISEDGGDDGTYSSSLQLFDAFLVDGQALTPDVFGFYKEGDGYVSAGSTQATDFRPGQWVPKRPRIIKTEIERRGGFGVNGFYLPMNDSSNPGADFHCDPNSIITLKGEDLPQPRNGAPTTTDAYVSQLRQEVSTLGFDGAVKFDGNGDYLSLSTTSDFAFGTDDFTVEFWAWIESSQSSTLQPIFDNDYNSAGGIAIAIRHSDSRIFVGDNESGLGLNLCQFIAPFALNSWNHFVVVADGGTYKAFVNGVACSLGSGSTTVVNTTRSSGTTEIGRLVGQTSLDAQCFISNLRVVKGTALYTANFTAPTEPLTNVTNTVLLCCNSSTSATAATVTPGTITANGDVLATRNELTGSIVLAVPGISGGQGNGYGDYSADIKGSGSNKTLTANGNAGVAMVASHYGSALIFDGTGDSLQGPLNDSDLEMGSDDFTVEAWVNPSDVSGPAGIAGVWDGTSNDRSWLLYHGTGGNLNFIISGDGSTNSVVASGINMTTGQWYHVVGEKEGTTIRIIVNGVVAAINTAANSSVYNSAEEFRIGVYDFSDANPKELTGYIQDVRVYKGIAKYKGGFDVPKPYTPVGIESWRTVADCTANNFATLNPLIGAGIFAGDTVPALKDGNLYLDNANQTWTTSSIGVSSGKYYAEFMVTGGTIGSNIGVCGDNRHGRNNQQYHTARGISYIRLASTSVKKNYNDTSTTEEVDAAFSYESGAIVGVTIDFDNKEIKYYKNGTLIRTDSTVASYTPVDSALYFLAFRTNDGASPVGSSWADVIANFGQNPTFTHTKAVFGKRVNTGNADSIWHQSSNGGTHTDWTISADGTNLQVSVAAGAYARAYLLASDGTIDPKKKYLVTFDYVTGPANLGVAASNSGGSIEYLTALDGSVSPNGLSSGNSYAFEFQGDQFAFTGFNSQTYELDNVIISEIGNVYTDDSGKGKFHYEPPTGFLALCEDNLPTPAIADPGEYFKTVLYTGTGSSRAITGLGFKPDLVWVKSRTNTEGHIVYDSVRGPEKRLLTMTSSTEATSTGGVMSFDDDGYSTAQYAGTNQSGQNYVAWCWKTGGAAVSNTDGSITSQVSANQDAGFSIVSYTGTGSAGTIGHGLGATPKMIIIKNRGDVNSNTRNWIVYHSAVGATKYLRLNDSNNAATLSTVFNDTEPTSSVFSVGNSVAVTENGDGHIAYCWAEIEGFSKFGSYIGNNDNDGPFVYCGFKPAFVLQRAVDSLSDWTIMDSSRSSTNPNRRLLYTNLTNNEGDGIDDRNPDFLVDFVSNGFKVRATNNDLNNTEEYIFMAFAESPFKTANAK